MSRADLIAVLERPYADTAEGALRFFVALVNVLRPHNPYDPAAATARFALLGEIVALNAGHAAMLHHRLTQIFGTTQQVSLFSEAGILPNSALLTELWRRTAHRVLPEVPDPTRLKDCFDIVFHRRDDHYWLSAVPLEDKLALWDAISRSRDGNETQSMAAHAHTEAQMIEAMLALATRIGAMGLEPELTRVLPRLAEFESPFVHLGAEVHRIAASWRQRHTHPSAAREDERHVLVLTAQCRELMAKARRTAAGEGTSLDLTFLFVRMGQSLRRLEKLGELLGASLKSEVEPTGDAAGVRTGAAVRWVPLLGELVQGENNRNSLREPFGRLTGLLALRVTELSGRTGEHYITSSRAEYAQMWRSAAGGGFVVGFMAFIKILLGKLVMAPLASVFVHGMNYSLGFVLIHVLNFTLATKQPAMTAATIAASIDESEGKARDLHRLADLVVDTGRSQFAAIAGNVAVAIPTALAIALLYNWLGGHHAVDAEKARLVLHDLAPLTSLAIPHAALTGILLFVTGLLSGYFDNKAAYDRIPERIANLAWLRRLAGPLRADRLAGYIGRNLGGLGGNFVLGIMLAATAPVGYMLGLPLDVRHVTLSSANFGFALVSLDFHIGWLTLLETLAGIGLVGFTNLTVSFSLALWVALRARGADLGSSGSLAVLVLERARATPARFFVPPRE
ncbi:MAG: site-specific recombinase [Betaproteobacteria bacterium]